MNKLLFVLIFAVFLQQSYSQIQPYQNPHLPIEKRVADLLPRMTMEEKFWQLYMVPGDLSIGKEKLKNGIFGLQLNTRGATGNAAEQMLHYENTGSAELEAKEINEIQKYFVEETRLGIPIIPFDEALHGLIRPGATAFPQAIGLAATWDTKLIGEVSNAIAMEVKSRGIRQVLSPVINIASDVRWGRTEETYGEDPFLTSQMGVAFISEFEKLGVIATPKHFVANVGDGGRDSYPINFNERFMDEILFPPFKAAVQKAGATSIMISYNSFNGTPCVANNWLLNLKLKKDWGFKGFVISDAGAIGGINDLHFISHNYTESTKKAIDAGLDVILQTSYSQYPIFFDAFKKGLIEDSIINNAVRRVLIAKFNLGLFENPYVNVEDAKRLNDNKEHRALAKKAALESIVLLKNESLPTGQAGNILPLRKDLKKIAVIGVDAVEGRLGGYSRPGNNVVNILDGIKEKVKGFADVKYSPGCGRTDNDFILIPSGSLSCMKDGINHNGLLGKYFNNPEFKGEPSFTRIDKDIDFRWTLFSPDQEKLDRDWYSVMWEGKIIGPKNGKTNIGIEGNDGYRLYINDKLIINNWVQKSYGRTTAAYEFQKGKEYNIKIEFYTTTGNVRIKLIWDDGVKNDWEQKINQAVDIAKQSDAAIVTAGIEEGEFRDRALLNLPGHQEQLIKAVARTGVPTIVVLVGGSAITMSKWIDKVPGIIDVWYPGEMGGEAVADVLFGDYNPAGRLPITFPVSEGQLPLYYNHEPTGRGDDYVNLTGEPLFPFGFGLSYTKFEYSNLTFSKTEINPDENVIVKFNVKNTGKLKGDEVVQLYIKDLYASVVRPVLELKGFQRILLNPGETKEVEFTITPELLSIVNKDLQRIVEPGEFRVMIGASSKDIRLRGTIKVK